MDDVYDGNFNLGWEFEVSDPMTITHLGFRDENGDGKLTGTRSMLVGLFDSSEAELARVEIPLNHGASSDGVMYVALPEALSLSTGVYAVGALTEGDGTGGLGCDDVECYRRVKDLASVSFAPGVTFLRSLAHPPCGDTCEFGYPGGTYSAGPSSGAGWFGPTFASCSGDGCNGGGSPNNDPVSTVTVSDPPVGGDGFPSGQIRSRAIYQRSFDGRPVVLPLVVDEGAGVELDYRVLRKSGSTETTEIDWTAFAGTDGRTDLELGAGWYRVEVRNREDGTLVRAFDQVGVGEVLIVAGQSNSHSYGGTYTIDLDDRVSAYSLLEDTWEPATDPQTNRDPWAQKGSPWPYFGNLLTECLDMPVHILAVGWGSSRVSQWLPTASNVSRDEMNLQLYGDRRKAALDQAKRYNGTRGVFWHQGESDSEGRTSESE
ncbi:MAG: sialate O-acetylesterase, partial [Myxococcota bacterium]